MLLRQVVKDNQRHITRKLSPSIDISIDLPEKVARLTYWHVHFRALY